MKETLLALMVSIGYQAESVERQIDMTYAPCRELYAAAVSIKKIEDIRYVLYVCKPIATMRTDE